jgi:magnesium-transporting ATPase (P-type)
LAAAVPSPIPADLGWDPSLRPATEVVEHLGSDADKGLSSEQAASRLASHGPNTLRARPRTPLWRRFLRQFADPLVYLLLVAVAIAAIVWVAEREQSWPVDVVVILAILVANAVIGLVQERRAEDAVAALARLTAASATVVRDGRLQEIAAAALVPGDVLELTEGDGVAADARLLSVRGLLVLESALTGESEAVAKDTAALTVPAGVGDRLNMVHRGTAVVQGSGRAVVTATGMDTEVGAIAELLEATHAEPSPLQRDLARVSRLLGAGVAAIAVAVMAVTAAVNGVHDLTDGVTILLLGVSLAVAAVPEGLPAILSVVLAVGVQRMAARGAVVKRLHSVETLGCATVIASDKTGTLTRNEMAVQRVLTPSGEVQLTGMGERSAEEPMVLSGSSASGLMAEVELVLLGGALANNATVAETADGVEVHGDPTEVAFLVAARRLAGLEARAGAFERRGEVPFTAERRMMSSVAWHAPLARLAIVTKGAADVVLARCVDVQHGDKAEPLTDEERERLEAGIERLSSEAYRVLGVAYAWIDSPDRVGTLERLAGGEGENLEHDLVYAGAVGMIDPPRAEAAESIAAAHRAGVRVLMITGDHPATARRIASDLGIATAAQPVTTGSEIDTAQPDWLAERVRVGSVYARVAPIHKLRLVRTLQEDGQVVAMTGDGVNDAPALRAADIGVAMGRGGTEVSREAADLVLADDNFATIVEAVREGRRIFENIGKFLRYLLSSNLGEVVTVFAGVVFADSLGLTAAAPGAVAVPLLATQILWINLVTDSAPALAMGVDPEVEDVMARPPRHPGSSLIDTRGWIRLGLVGVVMAAATLLAIDAFLPGGLLPGSGTLALARTAGFTTLVFAQLFNALNSRSPRASAFTGLFTNRWLWAAIGAGVLLQVAVVHVPWLQVAFGTSDLDARQWLICTALASLVLWTEEVRKLATRTRDQIRAQVR